MINFRNVFAFSLIVCVLSSFARSQTCDGWYTNPEAEGAGVFRAVLDLAASSIARTSEPPSTLSIIRLVVRTPLQPGLMNSISYNASAFCTGADPISIPETFTGPSANSTCYHSESIEIYYDTACDFSIENTTINGDPYQILRGFIQVTGINTTIFFGRSFDQVFSNPVSFLIQYPISFSIASSADVPANKTIVVNEAVCTDTSDCNGYPCIPLQPSSGSNLGRCACDTVFAFGAACQHDAQPAEAVCPGDLTITLDDLTDTLNTSFWGFHNTNTSQCQEVLFEETVGDVENITFNVFGFTQVRRQLITPLGEEQNLTFSVSIGAGETYTGSDLCGNNISTGVLFNQLGEWTVIYSVVDTSEHVTTCTSKVTVIDTYIPIADCTNLAASLLARGYVDSEDRVGTSSSMFFSNEPVPNGDETMQLSTTDSAGGSSGYGAYWVANFEDRHVGNAVLYYKNVVCNSIVDNIPDPYCSSLEIVENGDVSPAVTYATSELAGSPGSFYASLLSTYAVSSQSMKDGLTTLSFAYQDTSNNSNSCEVSFLAHSTAPEIICPGDANPIFQDIFYNNTGQPVPTGLDYQHFSFKRARYFNTADVGASSYTVINATNLWESGFQCTDAITCTTALNVVEDGGVLTLTTQEQKELFDYELTTQNYSQVDFVQEVAYTTYQTNSATVRATYFSELQTNLGGSAQLPIRYSRENGFVGSLDYYTGYQHTLAIQYGVFDVVGNLAVCRNDWHVAQDVTLNPPALSCSETAFVTLPSDSLTINFVGIQDVQYRNVSWPTDLANPNHLYQNAYDPSIATGLWSEVVSQTEAYCVIQVYEAPNQSLEPCVTAADCVSGEACTNAVCVPGCTENGCESGFVCSPTTFECTASIGGSGCVSDFDCFEGTCDIGSGQCFFGRRRVAQIAEPDSSVFVNQSLWICINDNQLFQTGIEAVIASNSSTTRIYHTECINYNGLGVSQCNNSILYFGAASYTAQLDSYSPVQSLDYFLTLPTTGVISSATCQVNISVLDVTAPIFNYCPDVTPIAYPIENPLGDSVLINYISDVIYTDIVFNMSDNGASSAAESYVSVFASYGDIGTSYFYIGENTPQPILYTAYDSAGNSAICNTSIQVQDITPPALSQCSASAYEIPNIEGDHFGVIRFFCNETGGVSRGPGQGCTVVGTVDNIAFIPSTPPIFTDAAGNLTLSGPCVEQLQNISIGVSNQIICTITATDTAGNSESCQITVLVRDVELPTIQCGNVTHTYGDQSSVAWNINTTDNSITPRILSLYHQVSDTPTFLNNDSPIATSNDGTTTLLDSSCLWTGSAGPCQTNIYPAVLSFEFWHAPFLNELPNSNLTTQEAADAYGDCIPPQYYIDKVGISSTTLSSSTFCHSPYSLQARVTDASGNEATCDFKLTIRGFCGDGFMDLTGEYSVAAEECEGGTHPESPGCNPTTCLCETGYVPAPDGGCLLQCDPGNGVTGCDLGLQRYPLTNYASCQIGIVPRAGSSLTSTFYVDPHKPSFIGYPGLTYLTYYQDTSKKWDPATLYQGTESTRGVPHSGLTLSGQYQFDGDYRNWVYPAIPTASETDRILAPARQEDIVFEWHLNTTDSSISSLQGEDCLLNNASACFNQLAELQVCGDCVAENFTSAFVFNETVGVMQEVGVQCGVGYEAVWNATSGCWVFPLCRTGVVIVGEPTKVQGNLITCLDESPIVLTNELSGSNYANATWNLTNRIQFSPGVTLNDLTIEILNIVSGSTLNNPAPANGGKFVMAAGATTPTNRTVSVTAQVNGSAIDLGCAWDVTVSDVIDPIMQCNAEASVVYESTSFSVEQPECAIDADCNPDLWEKCIGFICVPTTSCSTPSDCPSRPGAFGIDCQGGECKELCATPGVAGCTVFGEECFDVDGTNTCLPIRRRAMAQFVNSTFTTFPLGSTILGIAPIDDYAAYNASDERGDGLIITIQGVEFNDETSPLSSTTNIVVQSGQSQYSIASTFGQEPALSSNQVVAYINEPLVLYYSAADDQGNVAVTFDSSNTTVCSVTIQVLDKEAPVFVSPCPLGPIDATNVPNVGNTVPIADLLLIDIYDNHDVWVNSNTGSGGAQLIVTSLTDDDLVEYADGYTNYVSYPVDGSPASASTLRLVQNYTFENISALVLPGTIVPQTNTLTLTATDLAGNSATCIVTIEVKDNEAPTFDVCQGEVTLSMTGNDVAFDLNTYIQVSDNVETNSSNINLVYQILGSNTSIVNTTTVFLGGVGKLKLPGALFRVLATDPAGNTNQCDINITVVDTGPPTLTCPSPNTIVSLSQLELLNLYNSTQYYLDHPDTSEAGPVGALANYLSTTGCSGQTFSFGNPITVEYDTLDLCVGYDDNDGLNNNFAPSFTITLSPDPPRVTTGPNPAAVVNYTVSTEDPSGNTQSVECQMEIVDDIPVRVQDCDFITAFVFLDPNQNYATACGTSFCAFYPSPNATIYETILANINLTYISLPYFEDNVQITEANYFYSGTGLSTTISESLEQPFYPNTSYQEIIPAFYATSTLTIFANDALNTPTLCRFLFRLVDFIPPEVKGCAAVTISNTNGAFCNSGGSLCNFTLTYNVTDALALGEGTTSSEATRGVTFIEKTIEFINIEPGNFETHTQKYVDLFSNIATCTFTVTVTDDALPEIVCSDPLDGGIARELVDGEPVNLDYIFPEITATDNGGAFTASCGDGTCISSSPSDLTITCTVTSYIYNETEVDNITIWGPDVGACYDNSTHGYFQGLHFFEYTATDGAGNTATCNFTITVIDIYQDAQIAGVQMLSVLLTKNKETNAISGYLRYVTATTYPWQLEGNARLVSYNTSLLTVIGSAVTQGLGSSFPPINCVSGATEATGKQITISTGPNAGDPDYCLEQHTINFDVTACNSFNLTGAEGPSVAITHQANCDPNLDEDKLENTCAQVTNTGLDVALRIYAQDFCDVVIDTVELNGRIFPISKSSAQDFINGTGANKQWSSADITDGGYVNTDFVYQDGFGGVDVCFLVRLQGDSTGGGGSDVIDIETVTLDTSIVSRQATTAQGTFVILEPPTKVLEALTVDPSVTSSNVVVACYLEDDIILANGTIAALIEVDVEITVDVTYVLQSGVRRRVRRRNFLSVGNINLPKEILLANRDEIEMNSASRRILLQDGSETYFSEIKVAETFALQVQEDTTTTDVETTTAPVTPPGTSEAQTKGFLSSLTTTEKTILLFVIVIGFTACFCTVLFCLGRNFLSGFKEYTSSETGIQLTDADTGVYENQNKIHNEYETVFAE